MGVSTKIVVTGDDFGKSRDVNDAIELCHRNGILRSTSLVAAGDAFDDAISISKRNPALGVGVHLVLDEFDPLSRAPSSTIDPSTGKFYSEKEAIARAQRFKYTGPDLLREYRLQVEKVLDRGIPVTHLDHHHHLHLYWPVLNAAITVAKEYKIPYIRSQRLLAFKRQTVYKKTYRVLHQCYLKNRVGTTDGYFDLIDSDFDKIYGQVTKLVALNYGFIEIVAHPCQRKQHEIIFLTNVKVINLFERYRLGSFGNI